MDIHFPITKNRRAQLLTTAAALAALLPASAKAADFIWRPDDEPNSWFETDNWDPDRIPTSGESVDVNVDASESMYYTANLRAPSPEEQDAYFTSMVSVDGNYYKVYRIGDLAVANDQGPLTAPAMYLNTSGSRTTNGILHSFGLVSGRASIGKNSYNGYMRFSGGLWEPSSLTVGDSATGYFWENGGILITPSIGVLRGTCYFDSAKVYTDIFGIHQNVGLALAHVVASTIIIKHSFDNRYGGQLETEFSQIDIGADAPAPQQNVFSNDERSSVIQEGGSIVVHGQAVMWGQQTIGGYFQADSAEVDVEPTNFHSLQLKGTGFASLGLMEIGTVGRDSKVDVLESSTLKADSILLGHFYSFTVPQPQDIGSSVLNISANAEVSGAITLGGPLVPGPSPNSTTLYGAPGYVTVTGAGTLTAGSASVSQSALGKGELKTFTGGKVNVTGDLKVGDAPAADGSIQSYDTGSEIAGNKIWIGKEAGSKGTAYATNGGALRAPDTVILGSLTGASDASLTVGGVNPAGGFFGPGPVISPSILRAGTTPTNTRVIFQHNAAAYGFDPRLQYVDLVTSTGTGRTTLNGRIWDTGVVQATAGTLEIKYNQVPNTTDFLVAQDSGNIEINGAIVKTPNVAFARTLIGVIGSGEVTVLGGGRLESSIVVGSATPGATTSGTLNVQGANSTVLVQGLPLRVGIGNRGNLHLSDGGKVINNDPAHTTDAIVGDAATGFGDVIVTGAGSRWDVGNLTAGNQGKSTMLLNSGGTLTAGSLVLGSASGSSSDLSVGDGSTVQVAAATMTAGDAGRGRISLKDGGKLRVGPTGQGDLILKNQASGSGELDIGSGGSPGSLSAKNVYGAGGTGSLVKISHQLEGYVFAPTLFELNLQIASGHIGTTALTSPGNFLSRCSVTSGGLRLSQGGRVTMDDTIVIGDGGTIDLDNYSLPYLEIDGASSSMDAGVGMLVGKEGDGEVRLKNGGTLKVRDNSRQATDSVILGDDTTSYGRNCSVVFGGSATTAPGVLDALGIYSYASAGKVIFNHSSTGFTMPVSIGGSVQVQNLAGTTLLTGGMGYSGATRVNGGTLLLAANTGSTVSVFSGATFGGKGTVARVDLNSGATLSPGTFRSGDAIATQRINALNFFGGSKVQIDLGPNHTCDKILNHNPGSIPTIFFPVTSGNITFDFRNAGINGNGVYPIMTTTNVIPVAFMNRLLATSDFPLQGTFQQTRITNDPASANAYSQLEFVVTSYGTRSPYEIWATDTYGLDLPTTGAANADPDHDGLQNMLEFVLGSSPVSGAMSRLPVAAVSGGALQFGFDRRLLLQGYFTTAVEYSPDLVNWTTATASMLSIGAADDDGFEPLTYTIPLPPGATKLFGRLRVTQVTP